MMSKRVAEAIRGAIVADAASMGTHWIYDPAEMAKTLTSLTEPEFKDPPSPNYYSSKDFPGHYGKGQPSPYGEQLLFAANYVAKDADVEGDAMSKDFLEWVKTFGGRPDGAANAFVKNMEEGKIWPECGADDSQAHIFMKIVPVTCRYAGDSKLKEKVTEAIKVHQNNDTAIAFGVASARILEAVLLGAESLPKALDTVKSNLQEDLDQPDDVIKAFERAKTVAATETSLSDFLRQISNEIMKDQPDSPFFNLAGRSCALPGSFMGPLVLFYREADYVSALRENIIASGDTCSRAVFIGAVLAAKEAAVPDDWVGKLDDPTKESMESLSAKLTAFHDA